MSPMSFGGGYVDGTQVLTRSNSIAVPGTTAISTSSVPVFNNATLTDQNMVAEVHNDVIKTPSTSDPVSTVTGNNYHDETDLVIRGRGLNIAFTRTYNSDPSATKTAGPLGYGWTHSYNMRLKSNDYGICPNCTSAQAAENGNNKTSSITYTDERGGDHNYLVNESSYAITPPQGEFDALAFDTPSVGQHTLTFRNGTKYIFETPSGTLKTTPGVIARLKQIADPYGNQLNFTYDANGRLSAVTDNLGIAGRTGLTFTYNGNGNLQTLSDWTGRTWTYGYDGTGNLASITNPLSQATTYAYATGTHNLTGVTAPLARSGTNVKTTFTYYQNGKTFNYSDALGNTETLDYDLYRKTTRVTGPRGGIRAYEYDSSGRLTKLTEPDGAILLFTNGPDGLRYVKTDGLGYLTQYSYKTDKTFNTASDTYGNVTREQDALNQTVDYTYGIYDQIATVKDKRGTVRTVSYYSTTGSCGYAGKPQNVKLSALSGATNVLLEDYCWNSDGTLNSKTEYLLPGNTTRKRITSYVYQTGTNGLNVAQINVNGSGTTITANYTYDALGRKTSETLLRRISATNATLQSLTTTYEYDALDRVTAVIDPLGNRVETTYDANGKPWQITAKYKKPDGTFDVRTLVTRTYDAADRLLTETDTLGNVTRYTYDQAGNVASVTDAENHTTRFEYDAMNRRTAIIDPNGNRSQTTYNLAGRVTAISNANGETVSTTYDAIGRLLTTTDAKGGITQYSYDANGNRICLIDANAVAGLQPKNSSNCTVSTTYDELNRPTQVKDALNGLTSTTYDLLGNITSLTDPSGKVTSYAYDDLGRLLTVTDPLNKTTSTTWDEAGNLLTTTNRLNQTTRRTYDLLNRPVLIEYLTDNKSESIAYDIYGNRQSIANDAVTYTYTYDTKNRLKSKTDSRANRSLSFTYDKVGNILTKTDYQGHITYYTYDSANQVVSLRNPDYLSVSYQHDGAGRLLTRNLSNGAKSSYTFDANGWLASLQQTGADGTVLGNTTYSRDKVGNITSQTDSAGPASGTTSYTYDALYRLLSADYPGTAFDESYTYDSVGNRSTHTRNGTLRTYEYFATSNRLKTVHLGNISGTVEKSYVYDDEGRLSIQSGSPGIVFSWDQKNRAKGLSVGSINENFSYDPLDYRIGATGGTGGSKDYYLEGEHLEAIYSGGNLQAKYLRGVTTDELVAGWQYDANGKLIPYIYHHDNETSVTGISGHTGTALETLAYGAFGNTRADSGTTPNKLKYTGREEDSDSGLYYYRARYYDPSIGRFISEDPLGFQAGINFYAYVGNNPVNANDPSGNILNMLAGGALNVAIGVGATCLVSSCSNYGWKQATLDFSIGFATSGVGTLVAMARNSAFLASKGSAVVGVAQKTQTLGHVANTEARAVAAFQEGADTVYLNRAWGTASGVKATPKTGLARRPDLIAKFSQEDGSILLRGEEVASKTDVARVLEGRLEYGADAVNALGTDVAAEAGGTIASFGFPLAGKTYGFTPLPIPFGLGTATSLDLGIQGMGASNAAAGGYVLYPNRPNTNGIQSVYQK